MSETEKTAKREKREPVNLTEEFVRDLKPDGRDVVIADKAQPGFVLRVRESGAKVYCLQYRSGGKLHRLKLGEVAKGAKVAATRSRATILLGRIEAGEGAKVIAELSRRGVHGGLTCSEFFETFAEDSKNGKRKVKRRPSKWRGRTEATYRGVWARSIAPHVGKVPVASVDDADVEAIIRACNGKLAAEAGALRLLRAVLSYAEKKKLRPKGSNPIEYDSIFKSPLREAQLSAADYAALGAALDAAENARTITPHVALCIRLLALTGARKLEIAAAKWSYYDAAGAALHLPESKTGPKDVVIPAAGRRLLADAQRVDGNPFIIVGYRVKGRAGNVDRAFYRVREAAGIPKLRIHDLRHAWATTAGRLGVSLPAISAALGHALPGVTGGYVHVSASDVRPQVETVGAWIADALAGRVPGVLVFPGAAQREGVA